MTRRHRKKQLPAWLMVVLQLLLTGFVLCVFALFHHVLPRLRMDALPPEPIGTVERHEPTPEPVAEETPEPEIPWSVRFAEHFAEEPRVDGLSYASPNVAIEITRYDHPESFPTLTYFVADVYVADVLCLKTGTPQNETFASGEWIAKVNDAILAINGDSMLTSHDGFVVRNGAIYQDTWSTWDLCVLYYDGTMEVYGPEDYTKEEILAREPYQVWQFGPSLLDGEGQPLAEFNISRELKGVHPRTAIGYYEPGHYCFVVVDGRQGNYSVGADIDTLARLMSELGCRIAYNLDGGASSMMVFDGKTVSKPSGKRYISDMLVVTERGLTGEGEP